MGRWDALKPDKDGGASSARRIRPRKVQQKEPLVLFETQVLECQGGRTSASKLIKLSQLIVDNIEDIPVEKVVPNVEKIFLKRLLSPTLLSEPDTQQIIPAVLHLLSAITKSNRYLSTVMGPLVKDVTDVGKEDQSCNPLRLQIFQLQENLLLSLVKSRALNPRRALDLCSSLTATLNAARAVDGTRKHGGAVNFDVSPKHILMFVEYCLSTPKSNFPQTTLDDGPIVLLHSFLERHPESSISLSLDLVTTQTTNFHSPSDRAVGSSLLLEAIRSNPSMQEMGYSCVALLLNGSPFELWLRQTTTSTRRASHFQERVLLAIENVVTLASFSISRRPILSTVYDLLMSILTRFPTENISKQLRKLGLDLCGALFKEVLEFGTEPIVDALISSLGGHVTPSGSITAPSPLLQLFLCDKETGPVFEDLLRVGSEKKSCSRLLRALLRSMPELLQCESAWQTLRNKCLRVPEEAATAELLEATLGGRQRNRTTKGHDQRRILDLVKSFVEVHLCVKSPNRRLACSLVGLLLASDWSQIGQGNPWITRLLSICSDSKANVKLRSQACKAVGDVCCEYFGSSASDKNESFSSIMDVITPLLHDKNASVRSMSLFSLGNLALAGKSGETSKWVDNQVMVGILPAILATIRDHDEKVSGNAVRTVGHVAHYALSKSILDDKSLVTIMKSLDFFVDSSLAYHSGKAIGGLTWKQRSGLRKKAWGSANALSLIFGEFCALSDRPEVQRCVAESMSSLFDCIEHAELLHEKIVLAASTAIRSVNTDMMPQLDLSEKVFRMCNRCIQIIPRDNFTKELHAEHGLLLLHLLKSMPRCQVTDWLLSLESIRQRDSHLLFLCDWLLLQEEDPSLQDVATSILKTMAIALTSPALTVSPRTEQRFASAYMQLVLGESSADDEEL